MILLKNTGKLKDPVAIKIERSNRQDLFLLKHQLGAKNVNEVILILKQAAIELEHHKHLKKFLVEK